jgi:hypothetical protein
VRSTSRSASGSAARRGPSCPPLTSALSRHFFHTERDANPMGTRCERDRDRGRIGFASGSHRVGIGPGPKDQARQHACSNGAPRIFIEVSSSRRNREEAVAGVGNWRGRGRPSLCCSSRYTVGAQWAPTCATNAARLSFGDTRRHLTRRRGRENSSAPPPGSAHRAKAALMQQVPHLRAIGSQPVLRKNSAKPQGW